MPKLKNSNATFWVIFKQCGREKMTEKLIFRQCSFLFLLFVILRVNSSTNGIPNSTGILFPTNTVEKWIPRNWWKITFHKFYKKTWFHSRWIVGRHFSMNSLLEPAYLAFWLGSLYFEVYNFGDLAKQSWGEHLYKVKNSSLYANHQVKSC